MDAYWAAPPVSRTITALTLVTSILVYGRLLDFQRVVFHIPWVFKFPPEIWRPFTSFWITGADLGILIDTFFIWQYSNRLERDSKRFSQPGDFFTYIFFIELFILITAGGILGGYLFGPALACALAYTYSQDNKGQKANFFIITFNVMWLPYVILLVTFIRDGPGQAKIQVTGLLAAHMYDFLTRLWPTFGGGRRVIWTPAVVKKWFGGDRLVQQRGYGMAMLPGRQQAGSGTTTGFSSSFQNAWGNRGQGRRLGGE